MTAPAVLRNARPDDAKIFAALHAGGFHTPWIEADFTGWLARPDAFALVAETEGEAAGFGLALAAGDDAELLTIAVRPELRGRGLGAGLLGALDAEARKRGLTRWVLEVSRENLPAIRLYSRAGFVEIAVRKQYYATPEGRADAIVMALAVGGLGGQAGP